MRIEEYENCCGLGIIIDLDGFDLETRGFDIPSRLDYTRCQYVDSNTLPLKQFIKGYRYAGFTWAGTTHQVKAGAAIAEEFEKIGFTVTTLKMGMNPKTRHHITMWVAQKNKKKKVVNGKPAGVRHRSVPQ